MLSILRFSGSKLFFSIGKLLFGFCYLGIRIRLCIGKPLLVFRDGLSGLCLDLFQPFTLTGVPESLHSFYISLAERIILLGIGLCLFGTFKCQIDVRVIFIGKRFGLQIHETICRSVADGTAATLHFIDIHWAFHRTDDGKFLLGKHRRYRTVPIGLHLYGIPDGKAPPFCEVGINYALVFLLRHSAVCKAKLV